MQRPSVQRPTTLPGRIPDRNPGGRPDFNRPAGGERPNLNRPEGRPDFNRPAGGRPEIARPDQRPSLERPATNRPSTLPGMVTYPNRPGNTRPGGPNLANRPGIGDRPGAGGLQRPGVGGINVGDRGGVHIDKVNVDRRNFGLNRPSTLPANRRNWDANRWGGNTSVWGNRANIGNNVNINIDNHFRYSNNFAYRPNYWGARPWWGAGHCHGWHHGHWAYGWNSYYYRRHWYFHDDDDFARGFMWGIGVWSLGNLIYQTGYQTYRNPYPAPPVEYPSGGSKSTIAYVQPVSVTAAEIPPGDDQSANLAETQSNEALERSRAAFRQGDYLAASKSADEALAYTPGDVTLHEYRALVFFALGKYSDAAGVLNSVLASGPGWGWDTMIEFYNGSEAYNGQLRKLEAYVKGAPEKADARFLLGYHYMVCGHMEKAHEQFGKACELQPADSISRQLRDLTGESIPDGGKSEAEPPARPAPVPLEQLTGTWVSDRGADGKVTFTMAADGNYTWAFMNGGQTTEMKGTYGLNDKGLLVLTTDDTQMVSAIEMKDAGKMHFTLVGAPEGDPGLDFTKG